jgi:heptosyltransferase II
MRAAASIERIVVRGTNWIGDAVMSVPALRELSRLFPDAEIVLHTKASVEGLFEDADFIDRILPFEKRSSRIKQTVAQADVLGDNEFDLAILFPNSFESALTTTLARIPRRIGYNKDLRGLLLTDPVAVPEWKDKRHEVYYYLNLIAEVERRFLGTSTVGGFNPDISLSISEERQQKARQRLRDSGIDLSKPIVAIGAGSTNSMAKRWDTQDFSGLAERLHKEHEAQILLVGAASEVDVADEIKNAIGFPILDLTGKTNIAEVAAMLSIADLLVANDMGLAHVAPAVGTRTVVIFGPTNPVTTRPFSDEAVVIRHEVECSPCMLRECPIDHRCMTGVSVERVLDACRSLLIETVPTE